MSRGENIEQCNSELNINPQNKYYKIKFKSDETNQINNNNNQLTKTKIKITCCLFPSLNLFQKTKQNQNTIILSKRAEIKQTNNNTSIN